MRLPPFNLHRPTTIDEATAIASDILASNRTFDWVAGGTDLWPNYKWGLNPCEHVISLASVAELHSVTSTCIGAMTRLHDLSLDQDVHSLIRDAASTVASVLVRRSGTIGGNLCLDTRCFWFNQTEIWRRSIEWCHKCDEGTGADCRVIAGQNEVCVATYQGDLAPCLMVLDAELELISGSGSRRVPLIEFFQGDGITQNVLRAGEFLAFIHIPKDAASWRGSYEKLRLRDSWDFPEAGVAVAVSSGGGGNDVRIATTALASIPERHDELVDGILSEQPNGDIPVQVLSKAVGKAVKPNNNTFYGPAYRRKMVPILVRRALERVVLE
ncbi:MAG TPA: FAD binding domain-containing protein [Candidatus Poseidoniales archaeon]|nr:FAD binding domain-containing protein [Candidatus Poseidoniales archaeon]